MLLGQKTRASFFLAGEVEDVQEALHVEIPGLLRVFFAGGGKHGGKVVYLVDIVSVDQGAESTAVEDVELFIRAGLKRTVVGWQAVGGDHPEGPMSTP